VRVAPGIHSAQNSIFEALAACINPPVQRSCHRIVSRTRRGSVRNRGVVRACAPAGSERTLFYAPLISKTTPETLDRVKRQGAFRT